MTQTFRQFVNWLKMNTRHLTTRLKSCTELNSQINKESNRQCTLCSQKRDFFHPSWQRLAFSAFNKWGKTPCTSLSVSASFSTCPNPPCWRAVMKRQGLQCTPFCVSQNTLAWNTRWGRMLFRGWRNKFISWGAFLVLLLFKSRLHLPICWSQQGWSDVHSLITASGLKFFAELFYLLLVTNLINS